MGIRSNKWPKPRLFRPGLVGPQIPRTDILTVATRVLVVRDKLPGIQYQAFMIDPNYGKSKGKPRKHKSKPVKLVIDWDNLCP